MKIVDAALLGVVQALTEFLPVSSSGHLRLAQAILGVQAEVDLIFDILLHVGTLLAVVGIYRGAIIELLTDAAKHACELLQRPKAAFEKSVGLRVALLIVVATIPTGVMGVLLDDVVDSDFFDTRVVGILLVLNGVLLWSSTRAPKEAHGSQRAWSYAGIGILQALLIGVAQGVAILPGVSRSGATIVTALFLGAERMHAARFSFLLSIPAILGALVLKFDAESLSEMSAGVGVYAVGFVLSAVVGLAALALLLRLLREARFHHFAWYCWLVGVVAIVWSVLA